MSDRITTEVRDHLLLIGLNRPDKRNAFDLKMIHGLAEALQQLEDDPELRCGVIFAHGKGFTGGLDLASVAPSFMGEDHPSLLPAGAIDPWGVHGPQVSKPLVCAVHGVCFTAGVELLLAADVTVAATDARFAQMEVSRGIFAFGGATIRWVARVGWGNAMRYLLTGDELDAAEALRIGLVQEVVEPDQVLDRAVAIGARIAAQAPLGVAATLRSARIALHEGPAAAAEAMVPELHKLIMSEDAREGLMAMMEKREPKYQGK